MIKIIEVSSKSDIKKFIALQNEINKGDPNYVAYLNIDREEHFDKKRNPFFEHGEAIYFLALKDGKPVGRVTAHYDKLHLERYKDGTGFFGHFDCIDDSEVAGALMAAAENWLRQQGFERTIGPMNFSINDEIGVLVKGFEYPPSLLMSHNPPYYDKLITALGYAKVKDVFAWRYIAGDLSDQVKQIAEFTESVPDLKVRIVNKEKINEEVKTIVDIFNDAWSDNWGFVPLTQKEVDHLVETLKLILIPEICFIAEINGEPAAMSISLPNINEACRDFNGNLFPFNIFKLIWRMKVKKISSIRLILLGIRKKFRSRPDLKGLSVLLYAKTHIHGVERNIRTGELGWTLEENDKINKGITLMGGIPYKTYRVYEKKLK